MPAREAAERFAAEPTRAPDFEDDFCAPYLRRDLWIDHYLPHWTVPERSRARCELDSGLRLRIDEDQLDWRDEDARLRASKWSTSSRPADIRIACGDGVAPSR